MNRLTRRQAIRLKCLECAGDSPKEVKLCHIFDCPLWDYRCGFSVNSSQYHERIEKAKVRFAKELKELSAIGVDTAFFFKEPLKTVRVAENSSKPMSEYSEAHDG